MKRAMNFNAGPAALPLAALERAREELLDFAGSGMSVMEHSHRGKQYDLVHREALGLLRELLDVPSDYEVLLLQGGASMQFAQLPMSYFREGSSADFVVTGVWGEKAVEEARVVAAQSKSAVRIAASTEAAKTYVRTPTQAEIKTDPEAAYLHFTSNETIHGVEFAVDEGAAFPDFGSAPLVCDMSSDFLWRKIDVRPFSFIYAGAQKNIGPSGLVAVVARKSFIEKGRDDIPKIFQYRTAAENESLYNTPPTFAIYLMRNVLSWLKEGGGLAAMEARNREKAHVLYGVIDEHAGFYRCPVERGSRSVMNVVFRLPSAELEEKLVAETTKAGMIGLKGHRSVGGIRVSTYNAVELSWVQTLATFLRDFARKNG